MRLSIGIKAFALLASHSFVHAEEPPPSVESDVANERFNPGETRGAFDLIMKPYEIPVKTTTYVDFVFNLPENLPDMVHIVFGEVINSQPKHLHHFVLSGCSERIDEELDGKVLEMQSAECTFTLGGWAPGSDVFGNYDMSVGVPVGRALGIQGFHLNVHYTDGEFEDAELETMKIAQDGIRVYYTPDMRPYSNIMKNLIAVPTGPKQMRIPPGQSRYYLTKTCMVDTKCKDASDEVLRGMAKWIIGGGDDDPVINSGVTGSLFDDDDVDYDPTESASTATETEDGSENTAGNGGMMGMDAETASKMLENITCQSIKMLCFAGEFAAAIQQMCPVSCGLCEESGEGEPANPRDPPSYRVTGVNYHAHLLGTEMYATLVRKLESGNNDEEPAGEVDVVVTQKQATLDNGDNVMVKDLKSNEYWWYDDQATTQMDAEYEILVKGEDGTMKVDLVEGVAIQPGDEIQVTCVYDSTKRANETKFGLSTYDEMCIISLYVTSETPKVEDGAAAIKLTADMGLRTFKCVVDHEDHKSDVWQGLLEESEDGRDIYFDHPIEESDMCTFPVGDWLFIDSFITQETLNCPEGEGGNDDDHDDYKTTICEGYSNDDDAVITFLKDKVAGYSCEGGTHDQKDSNEGITEEDCIDVGGGSSYNSYTCSEIEYWLHHEAEKHGLIDETKEYVRTEWFRPKCCSASSADATSADAVTPAIVADAESDDNTKVVSTATDNNDDGDVEPSIKNEANDAGEEVAAINAMSGYESSANATRNNFLLSSSFFAFASAMVVTLTASLF